VNLQRAVELSVQDRITKLKGSKTTVNVLINIKSKFIQIDGVFYNFGSACESESIFVRFNEDIDDWEEELISVKYIKEIESLKYIR
jgi:hypothetical protein